VTTTIDEVQSSDTPAQAAFRADVRAFLTANSHPKREASPWALTYHTDAEAARRAFDDGRAWQRTRFAAGMAGFTYPKEVGGQGGEAWQERVYDEEAANYEASSGFIRATIAMLGPTLMAYGTEEQQRELVPRLLSGEDAWCQLFSEPGAGSDLASLACRAVLDGEEFVVNGQKVWNSAAQWCDHGMLLARTNPTAPKHHGITFLLVDMASPGIEVRPLVQATGAAHFNEVFLENVRVPVGNVLGEVDGGWAAARTVLSNESAMIGGSGSDIFSNLLRLARMFGSTADPVVRQRLADFYTRERTLGLLAERIMSAVRRRERPPVDPSILKLFVAANRATSGDVAAAIAGPAALLTDDDVGRWVGSEVMSRYGISIGGGTNEVQRNNLAERALGLPREPSADHGVPWSETLRS
jgi:alkylation response protein AidB-like acyl-CoA dehydrogenase